MVLVSRYQKKIPTDRDFLERYREVLFNKSCFSECLVGAVLLDGAKTASRDVDADAFLEFGNVNTLFLKIWVTTNLAARVELRCAGSVRISSSDD